MTAPRWLTRITIGLAVATSLVLVLVAFLVWTGPGLRALLGLAGAAGVQVSYARLDGDLSNFEVESLGLEIAGTRITSERLNLDWQPFALLRRSLVVESLTARNLAVELPPAAETAEAKPELDLTGGFSTPLHIQASLVAVDGLVLRRSGESMGELDRVAAHNASLTDDLWQVERMELESPQGSLIASAELSPRPDLEHSIEVTAAFGDDQARVTVSGDQAESRIDGAINVSEVQLEAAVANWTRSLTWRAEIQVAGFRDLPSGLLNAEGDLDSAAGSALLELTSPPLELRRWSLERTPASQWQVDAEAVQGPWQAQLSGLFSAERIESARVAMTGSLPGDPRLTVSASGLYRALALQVRTQWTESAAVGAGDIDLDAVLEEFSSLSINRLDGRLLDGTVSGGGTAQFSEPPRADLDLRISQVQLQRLDPRLPGDLTGRLTARSRQARDGVETAVEFELDGQTLVAPVSLTGDVTMAGASATSANLLLTSGEGNRALVELYGPRSVRAKVNIAELSRLYPDADGSLSADLDVSLASRWPSVTGQLSASDLRWQAFQVGSLNGLFEPASARLELRNLFSSGRTLDALDLQIFGTPEEHRVALAVEHPQARLQVAADGEYLDPAYTLVLNDFNAELPLGQALVLEQSGRLQVSPDRLTLDRTCVNGGSLSICAEASRPATGSEVLEFSVRSPAVETLPWRALQGDAVNRLIPKGELDFALTVARNPAQSDIDARLALDGLRIEESGGEGVEVGRMEASLSGTDTTSVLNLTAALPNGELKAHGTLESLLQDPLLNLAMDAHLDNLAVLSVLVPDIELDSGALAVELQARGPIATPSITGELRLSNLQTALPQLGIQPSADLTIRLPESDRGLFEGQLRSGEGQATLAGTASWDEQLNLFGAVVGNRLQLAESETISLAVSPHLTVGTDGRLNRVRGTVRINQGAVSLARTAGGPSASSDVIIVDEIDTEERAQPTRTDLEIVVELEQPIQIGGYGLTGEVAGRLVVSQRPDQPMLASGALNLTGEYAAFGQRLKIETGRLAYVNTPLENPAIEIYASREVDGATVGVRVTGRANDLTATLESDPPMNESDQLSLLVLGRRPGGLNEAQSDQLAAAAVSLALSQGNRALGGLGGGMPSVSLTQELGGLAVAIGKQLSPRLYVGYTVDLLKPLQVIRLRYRISDLWTAETELGLESRGAIRYRLER